MMEVQALWDIGLTAIAAFGLWWIKTQHEELKRIQILLNRTREEVVRDYVTKLENNTMDTRVMDRFDRLEEKIDRLMER